MTQANRRFLAALVAMLALVVALPLVGQSLPGYFVYDGSVNRAVSVDARGILEALKVVYKADTIVKELAAGAASTGR